VEQGFSVNAPRLGEGSGDITGLLHRCEAIASDAMQAIAGMGGAPGMPSWRRRWAVWLRLARGRSWILERPTGMWRPV
jgi:hypothetical protein